MALQKDIVLDSGIPLKDAYFVIIWLEGNRERMVVHLSTYANRDSFLDGRQAVKTKLYEFEPDVSYNAKNYHIQGYEYLKTLDEFEDAVEVD